MRRPRYPLAATLAILAMALQVLLHAACMPAAAAQDGMVPICTAHGVDWVPAGDADQPAPNSDCPACQLGHCGAVFALPPPIGLALPALLPATPLSPVVTSEQTQRSCHAALPRGPPGPG